MKNTRILFVDPPSGKRAWREEGEHVGKNITRVTARPMPKTQSVFGQKRFAGYLKRRLEEYAFAKPVLWLTDPAQAGLVGRFDHGPVVFDCQEIPALGDMSDKAGALRARQTSGLVRAASVVFTQSEGAKNALSGESASVIVIPNGVDYELFSRAQEDTPAFPNDLFTVKNPILGHIGALGEHLELEFVRKAATEHPEWSFVFVGETPESDGVLQLQTLKNVYMLGVKPQKQLPMYLCRFDVCIGLYKSGGPSGDISPMKLYEYLASGRPIVSTPQPAQTLDYADVVYIAGTADEFTAACRKASAERDKWKVRQRIAYAQASSWDARVTEIERALNERDVFA
jgi:glycosyltransferase involved in cell wall biosynthesis